MIDTAAILRRAESIFGIAASDICGPRRFRRLMPARQAVAWALQHFGLSTIEIGIVLSGRDHSTIVYAIAQAELRATGNPEYAAQLHALITPPPPERRTRARAQITWQSYWTAEALAGSCVLSA